MTKSSVITNRSSITMAGLIIDYLFSSDYTALMFIGSFFYPTFHYLLIMHVLRSSFINNRNSVGKDQTVSRCKSSEIMVYMSSLRSF